MQGLAKILIYTGLLLLVIGVILSLAGRIPGLGHLPGDIYIERERYSFYFPIVTCLLISLVLSLVLYFFRR